ncbi:MAG: hypothetical protein PVI01_12175 [Gemmatimonadales bacterium]|jgi:hypothetical protein
MPYISQERRPLYDDVITALADAIDSGTPGGDINYIITRLLIDWIRKRGVSYAVLADAIGVMETAKLELYRRVAGPYEDRKIEENGDVYGDLSVDSAAR